MEGSRSAIELELVTGERPADTAPGNDTTTRVLIVDDLSSARENIRAVLATRYENIHEADSGAAALAQLAAHPGPWIVLLDWVMPELDGFAVCRIIRERMAATPPYVILMSAKAGRSELANGIRVGADEFLQKPIAPDLLLSRMRAARRRVGRRRDASQVVLDGLRSGQEEGSGELIVRDGESVSKVLFYDGRICWVSSTDDAAAFRTALSEDGVSSEDLHAVLEEARQTGRGFQKILVDWGLLDHARLRHVSRDWIRRRLHGVLRSAEPKVLFIPARLRGHDGDICFRLEELLTSEQLTPAAPPTTLFPTEHSGDAWTNAFLHRESPSAHARRILANLMTIRGTISAAVLDRVSGHCEGWEGAPMAAGVAWAGMQALNALDLTGGPAEDVVLSTGEHIYLLRALKAESTWVCYVVARRSEVLLGRARADLQRACRLAQEHPADNPA